MKDQAQASQYGEARDKKKIITMWQMTRTGTQVKRVNYGLQKKRYLTYSNASRKTS